MTSFTKKRRNISGGRIFKDRTSKGGSKAAHIEGEGVRPVRVVLAGNPNAGKTTLFNALTKSRLTTGNWHGVTTRPAYKAAGGIVFADVPGMYSFNSYSMEEDSAAAEIRAADAVINVVDGLTLANSLTLTRAIIAINKNVVVYVTKLKQLKRRGGRIDFFALSRLLGVPVTGNIKELKAELFRITDSKQNFLRCKDEGRGSRVEGKKAPAEGKDAAAESSKGARAQSINTPFAHSKNSPSASAARVPRQDFERALDEAYYGGNCTLTRAERLFYNRYFALFFFIFAILATFFFAFFPGMPGDFLKGLTEELISEKLYGAAASILPEGKVRSLLCDGIIGGAGGVLSFIPQLAVLYIFLTLLDESGVMSALSFVTDGLFAKVKLSGRAAFSLISGFGCTAAAILTTRGFTSPATQRRTVAVLAYIPCGAKMPVFLTLLSPLFKNPFPVISAFYFAGVAITFAACFFIRGREEELLSEVAPISLPAPAAVIKKLCFYLKGFIIKVATAVMLFCVASWVLSNFTFALAPCEVQNSMLADISRAISPLFAPMGLSDWRLSYAMISGFAAKENVAATISMLMPEGAGLDIASALAASAFILTCPACVSAFSASCKEVGLKTTLKFFGVQLIFAFLSGYAVHLLFSL